MLRPALYGVLWQVGPEEFDFRASFWTVVAIIALFCLTVALDDEERYCPAAGQEHPAHLQTSPKRPPGTQR